ncbi:DUF5447 family protein [Pseudomonas sp.]|uniref:lysogeny maintenance protein PflM n=1 Tax=Pseudomonas sp. TaxID=306 RepID=UPI0037CB71AE
MNALKKYLRPLHAVNCNCSVCWAATVRDSPLARSLPCEQCRPASISWPHGPAGRPQVSPAFICEKHTPSLRPPKYWHVYSDTGKPAPYVPLNRPGVTAQLFED